MQHTVLLPKKRFAGQLRNLYLWPRALTAYEASSIKGGDSAMFLQHALTNELSLFAPERVQNTASGRRLMGVASAGFTYLPPPQSPYGNSSLATDRMKIEFHLDCRAEVFRTTSEVLLGNRFGGVRCVATAAQEPFATVEFVPVVQCHHDCPTSRPYKCTDGLCYASTYNESG